MPTLRVGDVVDATGGQLVRGDAEATVTSFDIDTRALRPGSAFFALPGERTDGHRFLPQAHRAGAVLAVVQEDVPDGSDLPPAIIRVRDTTEALTRCGAAARERTGHVQLLGLTGSTGKTTTKDLAAAGLATGARVHRTTGNRNNHLGVPLTLLACPDDAEMAVVEMGMSAPGEIALLTRLARPDVGMITNVRPAHMESFENLDAIAAAKGELFAGLADDAVAVVNADDPNTRVQALRHVGSQWTFGTAADADVRLEEFKGGFIPGARLTFRHDGRSRTVQLRLGGEHAAWNALAAITAVISLGGDPDAAAGAMEAIEPGPGRGRVLRLDGDIALIDDSYNSSPAALRTVLEALRETPCRGRRMLVMGDMLELGRAALAYHQEAGRVAAANGVTWLLGVGPLTLAALETARNAGVRDVYHRKDTTAAAALLVERLQPGDVVVIKGSRGVGLDRLVRTVQDRRGEVGS